MPKPPGSSSARSAASWPCAAHGSSNSFGVFEQCQASL
jgi:hypothetical protein